MFGFVCLVSWQCGLLCLCLVCCLVIFGLLVFVYVVGFIWFLLVFGDLVFGFIGLLRGFVALYVFDTLWFAVGLRVSFVFVLYGLCFFLDLIWVVWVVLLRLLVVVLFVALFRGLRFYFLGVRLLFGFL